MDKEAHTHSLTPPPHQNTFPQPHTVCLSHFSLSGFLALLHTYPKIHIYTHCCLSPYSVFFFFKSFNLLYFLSTFPFSLFFFSKLFKSCVHFTLSLIHSLSLSSLSSVFPPCRCCVIGVIFIPVSPWLWPLDGWIFTFFTHWWPFPVAARGAPVSLLLCCWQTTAYKSHMDTANGTQRVMHRGFTDKTKVEREKERERLL